jgi:hypothetical protein
MVISYACTLHLESGVFELYRQTLKTTFIVTWNVMLVYTCRAAVVSRKVVLSGIKTGDLGGTVVPVGPVEPLAPVGPVEPDAEITLVGPVDPLACIGPVDPLACIGPVDPLASVCVGPVDPLA